MRHRASDAINAKQTRDRKGKETGEGPDGSKGRCARVIRRRGAHVREGKAKKGMTKKGKKEKLNEPVRGHTSRSVKPKAGR